MASNEISTRCVILVLTLVLSTLSFYLVERPGQRLSLVRKDARLPKTKRLGRLVFGTGALVVLFVGALSVIPLERGGTEVRVSADWLVEPAFGAEPVSAGSKAGYPEVLRTWQRKVRAGLAVRTLPKSLQPLQPHLVDYLDPSCNRNLKGIVAGECVVGNRRASHVAVLTGDSHAGMIQVALARALGRRSWRLHIFERGGCGWAGSVPPGRSVTPSACRTYQAQTVSRIRALRPDVVVLSENGVIRPYRTRAQISASLSVFSKLARRVIVLGHTPGIHPFAYCLSGSTDISRCIGLLSGSYRRATLYEKILATRAGAEFVDTSAWFCVPVSGGRTACPAVIENAPVFRDGAHVTSGMEPKLVPVIREVLKSAG